jgi:hypothetical protein
MHQAILETISLPVYPQKNLSNQLEILRLNTGEFRVSLASTLEIIGNNQQWFETLNHSHSKLKRLRSKGFSGQIIICQIEHKQRIYEVETISFNDCLTIWEYFANKGNRQATAILKACARTSLVAHIKDVFVS